ncbi:hypothetical protein CANARDRAFT_28674 [[Candida] arabinofermentans NRRL YB-2248]|uniref:Peptidase M20 dimerisation domain-containing protein n=1 Tax=[Candida] arabinofermentans NRRL YB-2248 TaxID=983967 RepID=A0A1E4SZQ5_9ASCO|nr:hypothetical protein CANARDRAFT_28674 [[Candida] arabinofermentans NRRL YB-2248]
MSSEKHTAPPPSENFNRGSKLSASKKTLATAASLLATAALILLSYPTECHKFNQDAVSRFNPYGTFSSAEPLCPLSEKIEFVDSEYAKFLLTDETFRNQSAYKLGKAIQFNTEVDDLTRDFEKFEYFHKVLETEFPAVFSNATIFKPNNYGLILEFKGSNETLKPLVLMAHQDTVPIGDRGKWVGDPLSGHFDGEKVWGRGAEDCKNLLVGTLSAMDQILASGFSLERTVILSYGFDEEISGYNGAKFNADFLVDRYGKNSVYQIIDEGATAFQVLGDNYVSLLATSEKGYFDIAVDVVAPGGHSSIPYPHTSIGYMAKFIDAYEDDVFTPVLPSNSPMMSNLQCLAENGELSASLKSNILKADFDPVAKAKVLEFMGEDRLSKYLVQTSQAVDIIHGGEKINSLPRNTSVMMNHRIALGNTATDVVNKIEKHASRLCVKFDLGLIVDGEIMIPPTDNGFFNVRTLMSLVNAPVTPVFDTIWDDLTGSIRYFYEDLVYPELFTKKKLIPQPGVVTGNTDTRHYWDLTDHIFRWQPGFDGIESNIHNVNEYTHIDSHLQTIAFFYGYIMTIC